MVRGRYELLRRIGNGEGARSFKSVRDKAVPSLSYSQRPPEIRSFSPAPYFAIPSWGYSVLVEGISTFMDETTYLGQSVDRDSIR